MKKILLVAGMSAWLAVGTALAEAPASPPLSPAKSHEPVLLVRLANNQTMSASLGRNYLPPPSGGADLGQHHPYPVPDGEPGRIKGDEVKYNAVAAKIMSENGIAVDDLHAEVIRQGRPKTNNVHDTGDLSQKVADSILRQLSTPDKHQAKRP